MREAREGKEGVQRVGARAKTALVGAPTFPLPTALHIDPKPHRTPLPTFPPVLPPPFSLYPFTTPSTPPPPLNLMGLLKRAIRFLTGRRVVVTGSVSIALGQLDSANYESGVGNNRFKSLMKSKRGALLTTLSVLGDKIDHFLHVSVDSCADLGCSDIMAESDPFVVVKLVRPPTFPLPK